MQHPSGPRRAVGYRAGIGAAALATTVAVLPGSVAASTDTKVEEHCVLEVIGQEETGEYITAPLECFGTLEEALAAVGASQSDLGPLFDAGTAALRGSTGDELAAAASSVVGVHWDGADRTGSSISISGADCSGGWVNLSSSWIDRISSTYNACSSTRFYEGFGLTGGVETTGLSTVNLKALNDAANSVQYAT
jgi:hypothetical protein